MTFRFFPSKPRPKLDALLEQAKAHRPMTPEDIEAQRQSWVRGEMGMGSDADEAAYRAALEAGDTDTLNRLDLESEQRVATIKSDKTITFRLKDEALRALEEIKRLGKFRRIEDALAASITNEFFRLRHDAKGEDIVLKSGESIYKIKWANGSNYE